ncbi:hypothetical protein D7147_04155 [Micromonospora musae]|uniref:Uncharacterized protein n=1 Tax=Micromonospora musae TaxID=1894970 RepID=A0ABX9RJW2_9ACTN|nr:hypothetical protein [Micromonospora musae]RKN24185.1 hypothetical protein D7147_04155 [Micromonospora musae]
MNARTRAGLAALTALILTASAACTSPDDPYDRKAADVQTASEADITRQVNDYANQVATTIGSPLSNSTTSSAPCEGSGGEMDESIRTVQGVYNIAVTPGKHLDILAQLRDQWRNQGWAITEDRTFPNGIEGTITAKTTPDSYSLTVTGTKEPTALAILIHSDCYKSTDPL